MTNEQALKELEKLDPGDLCKYCMYSLDCPRGVRNYGDGPSFPPCADLKLEDWFDLDSYLEDKEDEE